MPVALSPKSKSNGQVKILDFGLAKIIAGKNITSEKNILGLQVAVGNSLLMGRGEAVDDMRGDV